jgi:signal transduction histidine kinase/ActR/RegA family two-component response regulator
MIRFLRENWKAITAYLASVSVATVVVAYYSHSLLLSPEQALSVTGPYEGYYWTVAQYQIQFERMDDQAVRYATGLDRDLDKLLQRQQVLQSKYKVLSSQSRLTKFFTTVPQYEESVARLGGFMAQADKDIALIQKDPQRIAQLIEHFDKARETVIDLSHAVRDAEIKHREDTQAQFIKKRKKTIASWLILCALLGACLGGFLVNARRARKLLAQNREALQAQQQAALALQEAVFAKDTMLGTISHELKTPLQTIISSVDLLAKRVKGPREVEIIERLTSGATRLQAQMQDLTDYARLESGRMQLRRIEFVPNDLVKRVVSDLKDAADHKGLRLIQQVNDSGMVVASDAHRIQQILANLITNAIKYTSEGVIQVSAELLFDENKQTQPWCLLLAVEDTGPGIAKKDVPRLFEPFTQIDQGTTRRFDGAGMGLAIVKRLVDLFGGRIKVDSVVGRGSRFEVCLPVDVVSVTVDSSGVGGEQSGKKRILLVDDNLQIRFSIKEILEELGYVCEMADSGKKALQKLSTKRFDAVLMDICMPDMDGFSVARTIRNRPSKFQQIPIVAISGMPAELASAEKNGLFTSRVAKPVSMDRLEAILTEILSQEQGKASTSGVDCRPR